MRAYAYMYVRVAECVGVHAYVHMCKSGCVGVHV